MLKLVQISGGMYVFSFNKSSEYQTKLYFVTELQCI